LLSQSGNFCWEKKDLEALRRPARKVNAGADHPIGLEHWFPSPDPRWIAIKRNRKRPGPRLLAELQAGNAAGSVLALRNGDTDDFAPIELPIFGIIKQPVRCCKCI
jgi:hypothetical protein